MSKDDLVQKLRDRLPPQFVEVEDDATVSLYKGLIPQNKDEWNLVFSWILLSYARMLSTTLKSDGLDVLWAPFKLHSIEGILLTLKMPDGTRKTFAARHFDLYTDENKVFTENRRVQVTERKAKRSKKKIPYPRVILEGNILKLMGLGIGEGYRVDIYNHDGKAHAVLTPEGALAKLLPSTSTEDEEELEDEESEEEDEP